MTAQREAILAQFLATKGHVSAEELYHALHARNPGIGQATVFRNMRLLAESGLAEEVRLDARTTRYEFVAPGEHHDHFRCSACGKLQEFRDEGLERAQQQAADRLGWQLEGHRLELWGLCPACRARG